ncbi:transglutaminase TgpA family protein [Cytobacillus kochii]
MMKRFSTLVLYLFGFLLIWEWIRPLEQLTDTGNVWVFLLFLCIALAMDFLKWHWVIRFVINGAIIFFSLMYIYFLDQYGLIGSFPMMIQELFDNFLTMLQAQWTAITDMFRTLLFFILLWLMSYLIQYWLIQRRQIFIFFFMTLVYITVLDTFTPYNAEMAIIRTVICGFLMMGILAFYRQLEKEDIETKPSKLSKWMIPLSGLVLISSLIAFAAPKADPIWPDPVPYITSFNEDSRNEEAGGVRKIGYGEDDSLLGGSFVPDDTLVFVAKTEDPHYWKVETKDVYTGKGWELSEEDRGSEFFASGEEVPLESFSENENVVVEERVSNVQMNRARPQIVYPLGIKSFQSENIPFELNEALEKFSIRYAEDSLMPTYDVIFNEPTYSVNALTAVNNDNHGLDSAFYERYTQLPEDLPDRVRELAEEIVAGHDNWFNQIREIEGYFARSGFVYSQRDVAVPGPDEDYVDQFLFDTKLGYCDNFSTAMIVLARSAGIPTRWVKGFTEGERTNANGLHVGTYDITNNNAHSWVEAYFPGVGWIPFEPTTGFSNPVEYEFDLDEETTPNNDEEMETPEREESPDEAETTEQTETASSTFSLTKLWDSVKEAVQQHWKKIILIIIVLAFIGYLTYIKRGKWLPYFYIWTYKHRNNDWDFEKAYLVLLHEFSRFGVKRKQGQTLHSFAKEVDRLLGHQQMSQLTASYEAYLYSGKQEKGIWKRNKELWENLIKATIA